MARLLLRRQYTLKGIALQSGLFATKKSSDESEPDPITRANELLCLVMAILTTICVSSTSGADGVVNLSEMIYAGTS
jgi:hypothetical protein